MALVETFKSQIKLTKYLKINTGNSDEGKKNPTNKINRILRCISNFKNCNSKCNFINLSHSIP